LTLTLLSRFTLNLLSVLTILLNVLTATLISDPGLHTCCP
jgi:hypothetical protein